MMITNLFDFGLKVPQGNHKVALSSSKRTKIRRSELYREHDAHSTANFEHKASKI